MAERGVADIVGIGNGLAQFLVQPQGPGQGPGMLGHLQGVGQPGAGKVPFAYQKDLGLVLQILQGLAVEDPVAVPLKSGSKGIRLGTVESPAQAPAAFGGIWG